LAQTTGASPAPVPRLSHIAAQAGENQKVRTLQESISIRTLDRADLPGTRAVLEATGLFPPDMLEPMAEPYLAGHAPHHWLVAFAEDSLVGFAYAEPERMTDGTFNLLAIAVEPSSQRMGVGKAIVRRLEDQLREQGGHLLLVETSSLEEFADTRAFYAGQSFTEEARIRDFYAEGEDKILFWKHL
jgi:ribosomal protein S18 acetylase RimI-like enzyme